jgi:uncharacterized protein (DUF433 family)
MKAINIDPEIMNGTPVFSGTRVPLKTMFDYLSSGTETLQDFLEDYPSVKIEDVKEILGTALKVFSNKKMIQGF